MTLQNRPAFTLFETVVAMTVVTLAIVAVFSLSFVSMKAVTRQREHTESLWLAQEGLELVRFFRDANVLHNFDWRGTALANVGDASLNADSGELVLYLEEDTQECPPCFRLALSPSSDLSPQIHIIPFAEDPSVLQVSSTVRGVTLTTLISGWR